MPATFRAHVSEWLTGGFHLIILAFVAIGEGPGMWPHALAAMSVISLFAWVATYRRYRHIHDLPTSRVASAAQGYVELYGRAAQLPGATIVSRLSAQPCCWYRYQIMRRTSNNKWEHVESGTSHEHFLLVDDTGECVISPDGAEVLVKRKETWTQGEYQHTEWLLPVGSPLYALGEFTTVSGAVLELDERADVSDLLAEWKKDRDALHERFDANRDGEIDMEEWELARIEAQREVRQRHADIRSRDGVHLLRKPRDRRLFLLADRLPQELGRKYQWWSRFHLAAFLLAGCGALITF
jgi:hypothetical protein